VHQRDLEVGARRRGARRRHGDGRREEGDEEEEEGKETWRHEGGQWSGMSGARVWRCGVGVSAVEEERSTGEEDLDGDGGAGERACYISISKLIFSAVITERIYVRDPGSILDSLLQPMLLWVDSATTSVARSRNMQH
jgi:hypothetical protein